MPRSFPNPYAYESPIGQGLQNIAQMLLRDDGGAKAAMNAAHMQTYRAQADKLRADAEQTAQSTQSARDYEQALARNLLGANGGQGLSFLRGDKQTLPAYEDPDKQMTMAPREVPVAAPDNMTPEVQTLMRRALIAGPAIRAGGGNAAQIVDALNKIGHQQSYDDVLSGKGDPGRYYVANGGAPYKFDDSYVGNMVNGTQALNALGNAKVATEGTKQLQDRAQASNAYASAGAHNRQNVLVKIPNPLDPTTTIMVPASDVYRATEADKRNKDTIAGRKDVAEFRNADGTPMKIIKATNDDRNALGQALSAWIVTDTGYPIAEDDPALPQLMEEALSSYTNPGNPGYLNPQAATRLAIDKFGAKGTQDWNLIGANKTKLSIVPQSQRVENQGATPAAPDAANPVVDQARAAVAAGADPAKVRARLQQNGINPALAGL